MDYLEKYGIKPYINAHDTITLYGASRMAENTKEAMNQISRCFVDIQDLQIRLGKHIAEVTHNEAAYLANGAAGAVQLCAAVCMVNGSSYHYMHLPDTTGLKQEFLVFSCQHNCYDKAIEAAGGTIRCIGDADETLAFDLEGAINERTAAVVYFPSVKYKWGSLSLEETVEIAHQNGVPVIVDAAAQLPPIENLWKFTGAGADLVVFSGGKTLCGPQTSGLIVGKEAMIRDCIRFGSPMHGICRGSKTSRESMIGLCVAIDNYMEADQEAMTRSQNRIVDRLVEAMEKLEAFQPFIVHEGPVGQTYRRAFGQMACVADVEFVAAKMRERGIYIGTDHRYPAIYFSPLNLTQEECGEVIRRLNEVGELMEAEKAAGIERARKTSMAEKTVTAGETAAVSASGESDWKTIEKRKLGRN